MSKLIINTLILIGFQMLSRQGLVEFCGVEKRKQGWESVVLLMEQASWAVCTTQRPALGQVISQE